MARGFPGLALVALATSILAACGANEAASIPAASPEPTLDTLSTATPLPTYTQRLPGLVIPPTPEGSPPPASGAPPGPVLPNPVDAAPEPAPPAPAPAAVPPAAAPAGHPGTLPASGPRNPAPTSVLAPVAPLAPDGAGAPSAPPPPAVPPPALPPPALPPISTLLPIPTPPPQPIQFPGVQNPGAPGGPAGGP